MVHSKLAFLPAGLVLVASAVSATAAANQPKFPPHLHSQPVPPPPVSPEGQPAGPSPVAGSEQNSLPPTITDGPVVGPPVEPLPLKPEPEPVEPLPLKPEPEPVEPLPPNETEPPTEAEPSGEIETSPGPPGDVLEPRPADPERSKPAPFGPMSEAWAAPPTLPVPYGFAVIQPNDYVAAAFSELKAPLRVPTDPLPSEVRPDDAPSSPPPPFAAVFTAPAHFPVPEYGWDAVMIGPEAVIIYEGMTFGVDADGRYQVHFVVEAPKTAVTVRLQFHVVGPYGQPVATVTLPPITIDPARYDAIPHQAPSASYLIRHSGYAHGLRGCVSGSGLVVRRTGTARIGSVPIAEL